MSADHLRLIVDNDLPRNRRVQSRGAAVILGISQRTVQSLAMAGELPGAARIGGVWTFDESKLVAYVKQRERDAECPAVSGRAPKPQPRPTKAKVAAAYAALMASRYRRAS